MIFALCALVPPACKQSSEFSGANKTQASAKKKELPPLTTSPKKPLNVPPPMTTKPASKLSQTPATTRPASPAAGPAVTPAPAPGPKPPAPAPAPKPSSPAPAPPPPPAPSSEPACVNRFRNEDVFDPATNLHYRILPDQYGFCDGASACDKLHPGGNMPWLRMNVPDQLLDCQEQAGWWIQNYKAEWLDRCDSGGLGLFEVSGSEEQNLDLKAPILCVF